MIQVFAFYLFAAIVVISGLMTITARNPVHSVLWLILSFFNAAGLMLLVGAEFIAMLLVIVYVGAVAVLFLFVVMMLDIDFSEMRQGFTKYLPFGLVIAAALVSETLIATFAWTAGPVVLAERAAPIANAVPNTEAIGLLLYTRYLYAFEAAGLMLLIGAEFIAMLLVIVYVGAVAVLFLFVVMMLDIDFSEMRQGFTKYLPFGLEIGRAHV